MPGSAHADQRERKGRYDVRLHRDGDTDQWGITYPDDPEPVTGLGSLEISDLSRRLTALEAAWTVGGETLSDRLDRVALRTNDLQRELLERCPRQTETPDRANCVLDEGLTVGCTDCTGPCCE